METQKSYLQVFRPWLVAFALGILLPIFGLTIAAHASGAQTLVPVQAPSGEDHGGKGIYGIVNSMPADGLVGDWVISGTAYVTTDATEFRPDNAKFAGACVKVTLVEGSDSEVRSLELAMDSDCAHQGGDDDHGDDGDDGSEIYGVVITMPVDGPVGTWVIGGETYTVTADTEINEDFGAIEVGSCVKVELTADGSAVRELDKAREFRCTGGDDDGHPGEPGQPHGVLFGQIITFPEGLVGEWVVGNVTVTTNISTEFSQKNGPFAVGVLVKVEFLVNDDGSFLATEIKTAFISDGDDDGHPGGGDDHGDHEGKVFGKIEALPDGLLGIWQIDGISYTVTSETELNNHKGAFAVGQNVKVEYEVDADGNRIATEIKSMPDGAGGPDDHSIMVGTVMTMPKTGFVGEWVVSDITFVADENSKFDEENGLLAVGAFVKIDYVKQGDTRLILEMETEVPPGAGDDNNIGEVEDMGGDNQAAAVGANTAWVIGGRTYTVTPATKLSSNLAKSSLAYVNSYKAADGSQVATRISSLTLGNVLFLPAAMK